MDEATGNETELSAVGMLGNGAPVTMALEAVAIRKHGVGGWEPFHYEKISESEYEVTGGTCELIGGVKKWPGEHTTVIVSVEELAAEARTDVPVEMVQKLPRVESLSPVGKQASQRALPQNDDAGGAPTYLTVVLQLPQDEQGRKRIYNALSLDTNFFGAVVTATSLADEIAVNQLLEMRCEPGDVKDARERATARNSKA
ncbi:hypothetical protein CAter282_1042 [Collimonas arenae]|uniref:Uncharacterized protein n=1 Tax=Collimonas arenae TaxID=279058 RepID=A0A127PMD0_9BURK|nr:hypothetical protein [Collimonas arenae]AMO98942.1 hypothetical protein CAter10_1128 [Collimonas arenae]AMP08837.1 hypothetical protein CAter282_1042 [Collimonas arenae]